MKKIILIAFFLTSLFAQKINLKMVVSTEIEKDKAEQTLQILEKFFQENSVAKKLKVQQHLELRTEELEEYLLTVIKPIQTVSVKNELQVLLQNRYPDAFIVPNTEKKMSAKITKASLPKPIKYDDSKISQTDKISRIGQKIKHKTEAKTSMIQGLSNEWLALILLALAGLLLVYRSTRQINKIKKLQKKLETYQEKMGNQVDYLGEQYE